MIVFVLGAGASKPYEYPTGYELRTKLLESNRLTTIPLIGQQLINSLKVKTIKEAHQLHDEFKTVFKKSGLDSIDHFLTNNPKYDEIGRILISSVLIECENNSFVRDLGEKEKENWMAYFYNIYFSRIIGDDGLKLLKDKSFDITFNYDRSLEYFLFSSLANIYHAYFTNNPKDYENIRAKIKIHHMYGSLGMLDYEKQGEPGYKEIKLQSGPLQLYKNINIIHDKDRERSSAVSRSLLENADTIIFLGFGYDEYNIKNLVNGFELSDVKRNVVGSVYGMSKAEISIKNELIRKYFGSGNALNDDHIKLGSKEYLRHFTRLIPILGN